MLNGCTKGTEGSAFGHPLLSMSHVDVLTLVSLYIIKCEHRLEVTFFFHSWSHQDETALGIFEPSQVRTWQDLSSLKGVLLGRQDSWVVSLSCPLLDHWCLSARWRWLAGLWCRVQGRARSPGAVSDAALASCLCISQHGEHCWGTVMSCPAPEGCPVPARWTPMTCVALLG